MVDVMGHVAMGTIWAIPAWFIWDDWMSIVFIGLAGTAALLPDIDLWIAKVFPAMVHHHGVTHTVVFVVVVGIFTGAIAAAVLPRLIDQSFKHHRIDAGSTFAFTTGAFLVGGLSHLFMDMLSAPDIAQPIEPFWPVFTKPVSIDVIWYNSPVWNLGLLIVAVLLHVAIGYIANRFENPYRMGSR